MRPRSGPSPVAVGVTSLVLVLAGCASGPSSADDRAAENLTAALDEAASGVEVATLVVRLVDDDRTTTPVADVTLRDALQDVGGAHDRLALDVPVQSEHDARDRALTAVADATRAVADARSWVNGVSPSTAAQVDEALRAAADAIESVTAELGG